MGFGIGDVIGGVGDALGAHQGGKKLDRQFNKAIDEIKVAETAAKGEVQTIANKTANRADPFSASRPGYINYLNDLMTGKKSIVTDPGFQWQLDQSNQAIERAASARGFNRSGNVLNQIATNTQQMAMQQYDTIINRLMKLGGVTENAAAQSAEMYGNIAGQIPGITYGAGQDRASLQVTQGFGKAETAGSVFGSLGNVARSATGGK